MYDNLLGKSGAVGIDFDNQFFWNNNLIYLVKPLTYLLKVQHMRWPLTLLTLLYILASELNNSTNQDLNPTLSNKQKEQSEPQQQGPGRQFGRFECVSSLLEIPQRPAATSDY